jgi:hypothetical protein
MGVVAAAVGPLNGRADQDAYVLFDEGFYDCTMGTCPVGHRHMLDD